MSKVSKWKTVPNENVRHIWSCIDGIDCECLKTHNNENAFQEGLKDWECAFPPDWYETYGTPVCDCDSDMVFVCTQVIN